MKMNKTKTKKIISNIKEKMYHGRPILVAMFIAAVLLFMPYLFEFQSARIIATILSTMVILGGILYFALIAGPGE